MSVTGSARVPASTYRLQITESFDLLAAARTLGYLHELGVDWVYLSPLLASESGSDHGYDVSDHSSIDASRGRGSGLVALATEARRLGMGVLVDIVPNHVGIARPYENDWWWHVLAHGAGSAYATAFDIDWEAGQGRLLIPVVGDDDLLEGGRIANLSVLGGELHYHDQRFPLSPDTLEGDLDPDAVHARQHYELVSWRRADTDLNYRRFFTVNTLAAIRVEDPEWFGRSHAQIKSWFDDGLVDGLRVDHPDGLVDPGGYLEDLATLTSGAYVLIEKILEPGEELPTQWATAGTTGYDVLAHIDRVFVDASAQDRLDALETELRGAPVDWPEMVHDAKRRVVDTALQAEARRIARDALGTLTTISAGHGTAHSDQESHSPAFDVWVDAIAELLACFEVYRSYLPLGRDNTEHAFAEAKARRPDLAAALTALEPVLFDGSSAAALRFQQTSGMVMAKGVEDSSFYRYSRLTSLNEVGADPSIFSVEVPAFHQMMEERLRTWPRAMTALSTHDTKRGEDVRARITALSEIPDLWAEVLTELLELVPVPDPGFASLLWQAIVGSWPASRERLRAYAQKAMREAGDHTGWTDIDPVYEAALRDCVDAAFDNARVVAVLDRLMAVVIPAGWSNALSAKLLSLTIPGVPDVYQGSEMAELSLVDPDNRRPVDFDIREDLLARLKTGERPSVAGQPEAAKLLVTHVGLVKRRDRAELFTQYAPLYAEGPAAHHLIAFDSGGAITAATRLSVALGETGWGETTLTLPSGAWVDHLTSRRFSGTVELSELLATYPVALLLLETSEEARYKSRFAVWAPLAESVKLVAGPAGRDHRAAREIAMISAGDGWWNPDGPEPLGEVDYGYRLFTAGEWSQVLPDPRSRRQPYGVHGVSRTVDPSGFTWTQDFGGRQLAGAVVYELHVGTFTQAGTLDAAIEHLDHLVGLGIDVIEIMPVNAFNGPHGWGYDGVAWYAVHEAYGGPEAYARFVDAAHIRGLAVVQDVVYNHFGPSGNYLPLFGPYLAAGRENPWGSSINLDGAGSAQVRTYIADNVRMWFTEFKVDGLRLDAVHALEDTSPRHLLEELAVLTDSLSAHLGRPLTLIAESEDNDARLVTPREGGGLGIHAQWSDDFHHALHVALTGETHGYYADFEPLTALAKVIEKGFFHDGTTSTFRGRDHGSEVPQTMPRWRLVVCNQNHDQIGNRAVGDRLSATLSDAQLVLAAVVTLTSPFTPMLFQGEEWAAKTPFAFFSSHPEDDLGRAVTEGRRREFARMDWGNVEVPDPQAEGTFASSKLDWTELESPSGVTMLKVYRDLLALRTAHAELSDPLAEKTTAAAAGTVLVVERGDVFVAVNFGAEAASFAAPDNYEILWSTPAELYEATVEHRPQPSAQPVSRFEPHGDQLPGHVALIGRRLDARGH